MIMGQTYGCDGCESEPAIMSLSNLDNGDVQFVGAQCLPTWLRATADAVEAATERPDEPIDLMPTDSASPPYDPETGTVADDPNRPAEAPPQPTTDPGAGGTGDPTIDHGRDDPAPEPAATPDPEVSGDGNPDVATGAPGDGGDGSPAASPDTHSEQRAPSLAGV
jgi:hypothetical protein